MIGDYSRWAFDEASNAAGVLQQQGRILLDADWNTQTRLASRWQDAAARVAFGRVAAVPGARPEGFLVRSARVRGRGVELSMEAGELWADGVLVYLRDDEGADAGLVRRVAAHYGEPYHTPDELQEIADTLGRAGSRDAVVLEVWREFVSGFQVPEELIEPALGGVDTTGRMQTLFALRLVRLEPAEPCEDLFAKLRKTEAPGRLRVTLQPLVSTNGDCPVVDGGGYVGFEHNLYRVEIAKTDPGHETMYKWSQFNGGLVGRGTIDLTAGQRRLIVRHNRQAILRSGLEKFYLEIVAPAPDRATPGAAQRLAESWEPIYAAPVTLTGENELTLPPAGDEILGPLPSTDRSWFFRLWNGVEPVATFGPVAAGADPRELQDGIRLEFGQQGTYRPGDYWVFPVRAGEISNPLVLVDDRPPEGVRRLRVPLAVLEWTGAPEGIAYAEGDIVDRRSVLPSLSDVRRGCCRAVSPDEDLHCALDELRLAGGGCLCLLPGDHRIDAPLDFRRTSNITIEGFGPASRLHADWEPDDRPLFLIERSSELRFESFTVFAHGEAPVWSCTAAVGLEVRDMLVLATRFVRQAAAIRATGGDCRGWRLARNRFVFGTAVEAARLTDATIEDNLFLGWQRGIQAGALAGVRLLRNRFTGVSMRRIPKTLEAVVQADEAGVKAGRTRERDLSLKLTDMLEELLWSELPALEEESEHDPRVTYVGVQCGAALDVTFSENRVRSAAGALFAEVVENGTIEANDVRNVTTGFQLGLTEGLRFVANRIADPDTRDGLSTQTGLLMFGDAIDCLILDNEFRGVVNAISFEQFTPEGVVADTFTSLLPTSGEPIVAAELGAKNIAAAIGAGEELVRGLTLWNPKFFRLSRCDRTLVRGNRIEASGVGIGWLEGANVVDFRVSANAFSGCGGGGIVIEPSDWTHFVAEDVDTRVRLIDKNRFDVRGPAVRATPGAVRIEDNDIRLPPRVVRTLPWKDLAGLLAEHVYSTAIDYRKAVTEEDAPMMRMMHAAVAAGAADDPGSVNSAAFAMKGREALASRMDAVKTDAAAGSLFKLSNLARFAPDLAVLATNKFLPLSAIQVERFVVNLTGDGNRFVDNRLYSENDQLDGGVMLHAMSGEVTGNEIQAGRYALAVTTTTGQPPGDLVIEGNALRVTGAPSGQGKQPASYALAIPTLSPGNVTVFDNLFEGSVQIGAEPFSSLGLVTSNGLHFLPLVTHVNSVLFDAKTLSSGLKFTTTAAKSALPTFVKKDVLLGLIGVFQPLFDYDPHRGRAIVQFSDNRVVRGWAAIAPSTGGAFWNTTDLRNNAARAPIVQLTGNVFDYWARVVGRDVQLVGNHSQTPLQYRVVNPVAAAANIPAAQPF